MNVDKFKSVAINIKTYKKLEELSKNKFELPISMAKTVEFFIEKGFEEFILMQIEKLSKELKAFENSNPMSTDHLIRRCKRLQIYGLYLLAKKLDHIKLL